MGKVVKGSEGGTGSGSPAKGGVVIDEALDADALTRWASQEALLPPSPSGSPSQSAGAAMHSIQHKVDRLLRKHKDDGTPLLSGCASGSKWQPRKAQGGAAPQCTVQGGGALCLMRMWLYDSSRELGL